jgi:hypothetical protein
MRSLLLAPMITCWASLAHAKPDPNVRAATAEMESAHACLARGDYGCAVEHFDRARTLSPKSSGPWLGLGLSYAAQDRCGEAVPVLDEYLRRKPKGANPSAAAARARCQQKLDDEKRTAATTPAPAPVVESPSPEGPRPAPPVAPMPIAPITLEEAPMLTAAPPRAMAPWKVGLIATGVVLGVGLVVGGITAGVLASRGELHGTTAFTPVMLP